MIKCVCRFESEKKTADRNFALAYHMNEYNVCARISSALAELTLYTMF